MSSKRKLDLNRSSSPEVTETKNLEINTASCSQTKYECTFMWKIGYIDCQSMRSPTFTSFITNNKKVDWCLNLSRLITNSYIIRLKNLSSISCLRMKELKIESYFIDQNNTRRNFKKRELRPIYNNVFLSEIPLTYMSYGNGNSSKKESLTIVCKLDYSKDLSEYLSICNRLKEFDNFEKLLDSDKFSDVKFIVESKEICAHKIILSMRSCVFSAMFEYSTKEQGHLFVISDIKYNVMKEVLRYIYAGKVDNINEDLAKDLVIAADKYKIDGLKSLCEEVLIDSMSIENIGTMLLLVDHYNLDSLKIHLLDFLGYNTVDIDSPSFELVLKSLSSNMLQVAGYTPGVDYPIYNSVPFGLSFTCRGRLPGYYADPDARCQVWHWCLPGGRMFSFLCPNGTVFSQTTRVCDWWFKVDCNDSPRLYGINDDLYRDARGNRI